MEHVSPIWLLKCLGQAEALHYQAKTQPTDIQNLRLRATLTLFHHNQFLPNRSICDSNFIPHRLTTRITPMAINFTCKNTHLVCSKIKHCSYKCLLENFPNINTKLETNYLSFISSEVLQLKTQILNPDYKNQKRNSLG